ncbi:hypothetical protein HDV05_002223, partial [Chytridiales sp. JEL 0842]
IQNRRWLSVIGNNISQIINNATVPDWQGGTFKLDRNGDLIINPTIKVWKELEVAPNVKVMYGYPFGSFDLDQGKALIPPGQAFEFYANTTQPPLPPVIPVNVFVANMPLRYALDAIVGLCSLFSLVIAVYMFMNMEFKIFKASSPRFLGLILLGVNISFVSIWLFSKYPMDDSACVIYGWLKYMGFAVVFGALIVKTYRISAIFTQKKSKKRNLNDTMMFVYFLVIIAIWVAILVVWTSIGSQRPKLVIDSIPEVAANGTLIAFNTTPRCDFNAYK